MRVHCKWANFTVCKLYLYKAVRKGEPTKGMTNEMRRWPGAQNAPPVGPAACEGGKPRAAPEGTLTPNTYYRRPALLTSKSKRDQGQWHVEPHAPDTAPPKPPGRLKCSSSLSCRRPGRAQASRSSGSLSATWRLVAAYPSPAGTTPGPSERPRVRLSSTEVPR